MKNNMTIELGNVSCNELRVGGGAVDELYNPTGLNFEIYKTSSIDTANSNNYRVGTMDATGTFYASLQSFNALPSTVELNLTSSQREYLRGKLVGSVAAVVEVSTKFSQGKPVTTTSVKGFVFIYSATIVTGTSTNSSLPSDLATTTNISLAKCEYWTLNRESITTNTANTQVIYVAN